MPLNIIMIRDDPVDGSRNVGGDHQSMVDRPTGEARRRWDDGISLRSAGGFGSGALLGEVRAASEVESVTATRKRRLIYIMIERSSNQAIKRATTRNLLRATRSSIRTQIARCRLALINILSRSRILRIDN